MYRSEQKEFTLAFMEVKRNHSTDHAKLLIPPPTQLVWKPVLFLLCFLNCIIRYAQ